jgi:tetratricopeptide (TPR) repeat protein
MAFEADARASYRFPCGVESRGRRVLYAPGVIPTEGAVIANRYQLETPIGKGAYGEVWRATDTVVGTAIAIKILREAEAPAERARARREAASLRLLRAPGIVQLLDDGEEDGRAFFAMELARGEPFPGKTVPCSWEQLEPIAVALFEILDRVHAAGILHRDLKPSNVLVDELGRVTVLDFGLSRRMERNDKLTAEGSVMGTPAYLAPEQIRGAAAVPQTDLYAAGLMLYEALTGRLPHDASDLRAILRNRLLQNAVAAREAAPQAPKSVTDTIDRLLERDIERRPRTSRMALDALRGRTPSEVTLPWIGSRAPIERAADAIERRESVAIVGARGSGRTRFLDELEAALHARGIATVRIGPSERPFESVSTIVEVTAFGDCSLDDARLEVRRASQALLDAGTAFLLDDVERIDAHSRAALRESARGERIVFAGTQNAGAVHVLRLEPLDPATLAALFTGDERIFHLRSDAARVLFGRTGGLATLVAAELAAWERAGLAHSVSERFRISRESIDALEVGTATISAMVCDLALRDLPPHLSDLGAWIDLLGGTPSVDLIAKTSGLPRWMVEATVEELVERGALRASNGAWVPTLGVRADEVWPDARVGEARRRIVDALPAGAPGRLSHLLGLRSATAADLARESLAAADAAYELGRSGRAVALLEEALRLLRADRESPTASANDREHEETTLAVALTTRWLEIATSDLTPRIADRLRYSIVTTSLGPARRWLEELALALGELSADPARALRRLQALGPLDDAAPERCRVRLCLIAARTADDVLEASLIAEADRWARDHRDEEMLARLEGWRGRLAYRRGDYSSAAECHRRAAERIGSPIDALGARLNEASALVDAFQLERARDLAANCLSELADLRHPVLEARAEWLLRASQYRLAVPLLPDQELVDAAESTGVGTLTASIALCEAAFAWRAARPILARKLALRAEHLWRTLRQPPALAALARALATANGEPVTDAELVSLVDQAMQTDILGVGMQIVGLLARAQPAWTRWSDAFERLEPAIAPEHRHLRFEVLSVIEAHSYRRDAARVVT